LPPAALLLLLLLLLLVIVKVKLVISIIRVMHLRPLTLARKHLHLKPLLLLLPQLLQQVLLLLAHFFASSLRSPRKLLRSILLRASRQPRPLGRLKP
jgi:hypothetical protein